MKMRTEYTCPLELVHDMIKGNGSRLYYGGCVWGLLLLQSWKEI